MAPAAATLSQLRLLILSPTASSKSDPSPFPPVLHHLTGSLPSTDLSSYAGYTSHPPLRLRTKYYSKDVSLWCDELPSVAGQAMASIKPTGNSTDSTADPQQTEVPDEVQDLQEWEDTMCSPAAVEVRSVIGGIVLVLPVDAARASAQEQSESFMPYIRAAHRLREAVEDLSAGRDVASVLILQHRSPPAGGATGSSRQPDKMLPDIANDLETRTIADDMLGWDVVHWSGHIGKSPATDSGADDRNEFGEKVGIARVVEVLEGIDWSAAPGFDDATEDDEDGLGIVGEDKFKGLDHELQQEMLGLKLSMLDHEGQDNDASDGEDVSLEQMDTLRNRVLAVRDTVAGMPESQKQAFAKREIDRIMRAL